MVPWLPLFGILLHSFVHAQEPPRYQREPNEVIDVTCVPSLAVNSGNAKYYVLFFRFYYDGKSGVDSYAYSYEQSSYFNKIFGMMGKAVQVRTDKNDPTAKDYSFTPTGKVFKLEQSEGGIHYIEDANVAHNIFNGKSFEVGRKNWPQPFIQTNQENRTFAAVFTFDGADDIAEEFEYAVLKPEKYEDRIRFQGNIVQVADGATTKGNPDNPFEITGRRSAPKTTMLGFSELRNVGLSIIKYRRQNTEQGDYVAEVTSSETLDQSMFCHESLADNPHFDFSFFDGLGLGADLDVPSKILVPKSANPNYLPQPVPPPVIIASAGEPGAKTLPSTPSVMVPKPPVVAASVPKPVPSKTDTMPAASSTLKSHRRDPSFPPYDKGLETEEQKMFCHDTVTGDGIYLSFEFSRRYQYLKATEKCDDCYGMTGRRGERYEIAAKAKFTKGSETYEGSYKKPIVSDSLVRAIYRNQSFQLPFIQGSALVPQNKPIFFDYSILERLLTIKMPITSPAGKTASHYMEFRANKLESLYQDKAQFTEGSFSVGPYEATSDPTPLATTIRMICEKRS